MKKFLPLFFLLITQVTQGQPRHYTTANAHSHNDYEQQQPFYAAYNAGFGSIEADIFLVKGKILVAHDIPELKKNRSLEDYYIKPLNQLVQKNNGLAYADESKSLQMMIDIKANALPALDSLVALLKRYPLLSNNKNIQWVISGDRPSESVFSTYPLFIWFDGLPGKTYAAASLEKIPMISDDFENYSHWKGEGALPVEDEAKLKAVIENCHALHKKIRLWDAPDNPTAWQQLMKLGVDYINTDKIEELHQYLDAHRQ